MSKELASKINGLPDGESVMRYDRDRGSNACGFTTTELKSYTAEVERKLAAIYEWTSSENIIEKFKYELKQDIAESSFDFTQIFEELNYEGEKYVDISGKGIDDITDLVSITLERVLEGVSEEISALSKIAGENDA